MEILQWVVTFLKKLWKGLAKSQASRANSPTTASVQQQQLEHWKKEFQISLLCTGHRDVGSLQKYQRPETSTRIEFSKAFDSSEPVSLSDSIGSEKAPLKREVELQEEITCKFSKGCDEAGIPETKLVTFNQCTFIISKDWKLNRKEICIFSLYSLYWSTLADDIIVGNISRNLSRGRIWCSQEEQGSIE